MKKTSFFLIVSFFAVSLSFGGQTSVLSQNALTGSGSLLIDDFWYNVQSANPAAAAVQTYRFAVSASQNDTFIGEHNSPSETGHFTWNNIIDTSFLGRYKTVVFGGMFTADTTLDYTKWADGNNTETVSRLSGTFLFAKTFSERSRFGLRASFSGVTGRLNFNGSATPGLLYSAGQHTLSFWFPISYTYIDRESLNHNIDTAACFADMIAITDKISFIIPAKLGLKTYWTDKDFFFTIPAAVGFSFIMQATEQFRFFVGSDIAVSFDNFAYFAGQLRHKLPMESYFRAELTPSLHAGLSAQVHERVVVLAGLGLNWLHYTSSQYKRYYNYSEYTRSVDTLEIFSGVSLSVGCSVTLARNLILHICAAVNDLDGIFRSYSDNVSDPTSSYRGHFTLGGEIEWRM